MRRGWQGYRRWAIKCIRWIPIVRKWEREQGEIGRRNMEAMER